MPELFSVRRVSDNPTTSGFALHLLLYLLACSLPPSYSSAAAEVSSLFVKEIARPRSQLFGIREELGCAWESSSPTRVPVTLLNT